VAAGPIEGADDAEPAFEAALDCQACGACCSYSPEWPRFSLEDDAALEAVTATAARS
jgi:uncharacterized protein